jgi:hypothetical protein
MSKGIDAPSYDFAFQAVVSGSAGEGFTVGVMMFLLLNVRSQVAYPGRIIAPGAGAGAGIRGASLSNPSWTFFRTATPIRIEDFSGWATVANAEFTGIYGGSLSYITFWSVDHDPYWIDIGGVTLGVSVGASLSPLCSVHFFDDPRPNIGSPIAPS